VTGAKSTVSVAAWPGFKVIGKLAPDSEKPVPAGVAELMVTGAVPVDSSVTDCIAAVFSCTLPKTTLVGLILSVGTAAFNCRAKLFDTLPELAVRVADCAVPTDVTVAVKATLVAFAGTMTVAGTVTAALLLDRFTLSPLLAAAEVSVTVQASVPDPIMEPLLQEMPLNVAGTAVPVPLRVITAAAPVEELLLMLS
jgi:hypothetical protein